VTERELPPVGAGLDLTISGASVGPYDVTPGAKIYWDGVANGEVKIRRCHDCGLYSHPRQEACEHCYSGDLEWVTVSGEGEIYTFSTVHRPPAGRLDQPYSLGFVRLTEGVFLFTEIIPFEDARIGARVTPRFVDEPHGTLLKYALAEEAPDV
jgi:uncharacterized OB-fold protein